MITLLAILVVLPAVVLAAFVFETVQISGRAGDFPAYEGPDRV
jgi:hypothetical protein